MKKDKLDFKNVFKKLKMIHLQIAGVVLLILLAVGLFWFNSRNSMQSIPADLGQVYFEGEYSIAGGEWKPIVAGEHISSTKGEVTLRGNLHMRDPEGGYFGVYRLEIPVAFYADHINLTIYDGNNGPVEMDMENEMFGSTNCGIAWMAYLFESGAEEEIKIVIRNPHSFGNENAIDDMLSGITLWSGIDFEKGIMESGATERNVGLLFVIVSIMILGIALFSSLIHIKNSKVIWVLGAMIFCAGIYFTYSSKGVFFWSDSIVANTTFLGAAMMLYIFFCSVFIVCLMSKMRKVAGIAVSVQGVLTALFFFIPIISKVLFYDTWIWWICAQCIVNGVLAVCLIIEILHAKSRWRWAYIGAFLPLIAFLTDVIGVALGAWSGGVGSQCVFAFLLIVALVMIIKLIPSNINAAAKAKELEMERIVLNAELSKSRISTMMSQIRPHFIYNTLGTIEQLCDIEPKKAGELVHDFAKYLRGNFGELDNPKPIPMSKEMEHVRHYVSIENVRFPDMTFTFEMNSGDFDIPALTIQPIVENAIKHGLMKLQSGGTIKVVSYETDTHYCVDVEDDGAGFDTTLMLDERKHVGVRNIRERLKAMVGGTLEIESTVGVGTKVFVRIPKEKK